MGDYAQQNLRVTRAKEDITSNWSSDEQQRALFATMDSSVANQLEEEDSFLQVVLFDSSYEEALNQLLD
jgi:hypothetical protein